MKMTLTERNQWTAALRSGEYQQTKGLLRDKHGHCCLGVLETVRGTECRLECINLELEGSSSDTTYFEFGTNEKQTAVLTLATQAALKAAANGFEVPSSWLTQEELVSCGASYSPERDPTITNLNDAGISFTRIAELVELCVELVDEQEVAAQESNHG